ncbi:MAG: hypothetical protein ACYC0V_05875 [Armatimonadota bacterium]
MSDDFFNEPVLPQNSNTNSNAMIWAIVIVFIMIFAGCMFFANNIQAPPNPKVNECRKNIQHLGDALLVYVNDNNGIIPGEVINGKPYWQVLGIKPSTNDPKTTGKSPLKCYSDTTDAPTSYMLNESLTGKSIKTTPVSDYSKTALVYEQPTGKYHRWAFYLDGAVRQYND